ncbi:MAG: serine hydrolase, partial [Candidatus Binatia bacterium]
MGLLAASPSGAPAEEAEGPRTAAELGLMHGFPPPPDKLITLANWQGAPFMRWSLQHVSEIIPTARIKRSNGVAQLDTELQNLEAVVFAAVDGKRKTVADMLGETYTDGFIVLQNSKIVTERYFNGMRPSTLHLLHGITQSYIGTLAGLPITGGQLDPAKLVTEYISELGGTGFSGATVRQVLDMRTGVKFSEDATDPTSEISNMEISIGWRPRGYSDAPPSAFQFLATLTEKT